MLQYAALRADRSKRYTHLKIVLGELVIGKSTDDSSMRDWVEGLKSTRDWALVHEWFGSRPAAEQFGRSSNAGRPPGSIRGSQPVKFGGQWEAWYKVLPSSLLGTNPLDFCLARVTFRAASDHGAGPKIRQAA